MKKRILRVFLALTVFILLLSLPVRADEAELYQNSGADTLMEALPEEAQSLLQNVGADPMETPAPGAATKLFSGAFRGLSCGVDGTGRGHSITLLASCVLCRLVQEFAAKELSYAVSVCGALCAAVTLLSPMASLLEQAARVTDAAAVFLLAAVPVYAGLLFTAGEHRDSTDLRRAVACSGKCCLGFEQRGAHPGFAYVFGVFRGFCRDIV